MLSPMRDRISRINQQIKPSESRLAPAEADGNDRALRVEHLTNRVSYLNDKIAELADTQNKKYRPHSNPP